MQAHDAGIEASPIIAKIVSAANYVQKAEASKRRRALSKASILLEGPHRARVHIDYDAPTGGIILAFAGETRWHAVGHRFAHHRKTPEWAPMAEMMVNEKVTDIFDAFLYPKNGSVGLYEAMMYMSEVCTEVDMRTARLHMASSCHCVDMSTPSNRLAHRAARLFGFY